MARKIEPLIVICYDAKAEINPDCTVEVNNNETSITAPKNYYSFKNFSRKVDFRNLMMHMLNILATLSQSPNRKCIYITTKINTCLATNKSFMGVEETFKAIFCAIWGIHRIYPSIKLEKIVFYVDGKYQPQVEELLKNSDNIIDSSKKTYPMITCIERFYDAKTRKKHQKRPL